jgi:hypothetical protein
MRAPDVVIGAPFNTRSKQGVPTKKVHPSFNVKVVIIHGPKMINNINCMLSAYIETMPNPTTAKLKALCQQHDISGYSGKRKANLIIMVNAHYQETVKAGLEKLAALAPVVE